MDDRQVTVPHAILETWANDTYLGKGLVFPVKVNWPELRLTDEQMLANGTALANGQEPPYPDHSVFEVVLERKARGQ